MGYSSEQLAEIERQRAANPADRRIHLTLTPEQARERLATARAIDAMVPQIMEDVAKMAAAAEEDSFSGRLRRMILRVNQQHNKLARAAGIDPNLLADFRTGAASLPTDAVDRLIAALGVRIPELVTAK